jgi:hypothetical protein
MAKPKSEWDHAMQTFRVKINCGKGVLKWVSRQPAPRRGDHPVRKCTVPRPKKSQPEKLVIVVETGQVGSFEEVLLSDSHNLEDSQDSDSEDGQKTPEDEQYREVVQDSELEMKKEPST